MGSTGYFDLYNSHDDNCGYPTMLPPLPRPKAKEDNY